MNEEEMELLDGFLNKGWGCDLDEIYSIITKLLDSYNQEKEKNKKLEEVIDLMIKGFVELKDDDEMYCTVPDDFCNPNECIKVIDCTDCIREYYFNKVKENRK